MKRSSWRSFSLVAGICFLAAYGAQAACPSVQDKVCTLTNYREGHLPGTLYSSPTCTSAADDDNKRAVQRAFLIAHEKVQAELCSLKKIFVIAGNESWGLWENVASDEWPTDGELPGAYIALSRQVFRQNYDLADQEDDLTRRALKNTASAGQYEHVLTLPNNPPPTLGNDLAILAAMMHELGHIIWHKNKSEILQLNCFQTNFIATSWNTDGLGESLRSTWTDVTEAKNARHRSGGLEHPHKQNVSREELYQIYGSSNGRDGFATAAGGVTPEEDFVESFKISTLRRAQASTIFALSIAIKRPGDTDLVRDLLSTRAPAVESKLFCVDSWHTNLPLFVFR
jgi:hypothetical protein